MIRDPRTLIVALVTLATFADILAYSIGVPVLPDLGRRYGASPAIIGVLFASFGLTVLLTSVPIGALSDRMGRKLPLVGGLVALSVSSIVFAFAPSLPWLFASRLVLGAADAVTWVVGFAVVADLFGPEERGRRMGVVMSGSTAGFLSGPTIGGWLYEHGGPAIPFLFVALLAIVVAALLALVRFPPATATREVLPLSRAVSIPAVVTCGLAIVVGGGTIAMMEPTFSLYLETLGLGPARVGFVFGSGAVIAAVLHPQFGRLSDRFGSRRLTFSGLVILGASLPLLSLATDFWSAVVCEILFVMAITTIVTPSLALMAEATSSSGVESFGVAYGLYNFAWALGILVGPSLGGIGFERIGLTTLYLVWAGGVIIAALVLGRVAGAWRPARGA